LDLSNQGREFVNSVKAMLRRMSEMENAIFGVLICTSGAYDWLSLYKGVRLVGPYYASGVYVLTSFSLLSVLLFAAYSTVGGIMLLTAQRARSRYKTVAPNVVAIAAVFAPYLFAFLPKGDFLGANIYAAYVCVIIGGSLTLLSLAYLRRALTITPQATSLVTAGPYALVRHPMYSGSILIMFGLMLLVDSAAAVVLFLACAGLQIQRTRYEETLLEYSLPDYGRYKCGVGRFVPRLGYRFRTNTASIQTDASALRGGAKALRRQATEFAGSGTDRSFG
jgi:protein-S-isoprenylcysteine O-methyltransferase Ste14